MTLYLRHEKIEYYDKISSLVSELKPDFFRIHKGYLVNIKYVERYDRDRGENEKRGQSADIQV